VRWVYGRACEINAYDVTCTLLRLNGTIVTWLTDAGEIVWVCEQRNVTLVRLDVVGNEQMCLACLGLPSATCALEQGLDQATPAQASSHMAPEFQFVEPVVFRLDGWIAHGAMASLKHKTRLCGAGWSRLWIGRDW
jgi:hypothetical protein